MEQKISNFQVRSSNLLGDAQRLKFTNSPEIMEISQGGTFTRSTEMFYTLNKSSSKEEFIDEYRFISIKSKQPMAINNEVSKRIETLECYYGQSERSSFLREKNKNWRQLSTEDWFFLLKKLEDANDARIKLNLNHCSGKNIYYSEYKLFQEGLKKMEIREKSAVSPSDNSDNKTTEKKDGKMTEISKTKKHLVKAGNHFGHGVKVATVNKIGENLVDAIVHMIPSEEAKDAFKNEYLKSGTQGVLAFILMVASDEGLPIIPEKSRPYVSKACGMQMQASGFVLGDKGLDAISPVISLLIQQLHEAGKSLMSKEEIAQIEGFKARVDVDEEAKDAFEVEFEEEIAPGVKKEEVA